MAGLSLSLGLGLGSMRRTASAAFSPATLFAASEPGAWYDPSDLSTMFQDSAGTTPVTATGQTVGRILDKSGRGNHATQATAASRPQYQVDGNGKAFLLFDGTDDFLVTGTITPGIDKAQVFAGVRKLSDAGLQAVVGFSAAPGSINGTFEQYFNLSAAGNSQFLSRGTLNGSANGSAGTAPNNLVLTGLMDIAGDSVVNRVNGVQAATSASDQGTGNYLAYPLYIGRRGGTALPFNGRMYGLITRFGANLTTDQITQTEAWMNSKTGAY